ncbi:MAG: hypothetical protein P4L81_08230, partial [Candidatus Pacebacteria bacterium]|nr:hypothetical protein [Candidatus Paceibacterota bacterium]
PQLAEVGLPLRRSATNVSFIAGADKEKFATFDEQSLRDLNSRDLDQNVSDAELRVFAYDRDMGAGKCDDNTLDIKRISFSVPIGLRKRLRRKVLAAIDVDAIEAKVRYFRNKDSQVTSMLLEEIIEMEDVEAPA